MTRDEAFQVLGLYVGASDEHIRVKHAARCLAVNQRLASAPAAEQPALKAELARLDEALAMASGRAPDASSPTMPGGFSVTTLETNPRRGGAVKGVIVLAGLLLGLLGYYVITRTSMYLFDRQHTEEATPAAIADAEQASVAWLTYLSRSGRPETDEGRKAAEDLHKGAGARAAGDKSIYAQLYNSAWQGYFNAFRAEAARAESAWKDEVADPWRSKVQVNFPFNPDAAADAPVGEVTRILNPVSGAAWRHDRWFDALAVVELKGTKFYAPPKDRAEFRARAGKLRDALFPPDRDRINVPFLARVLPGRMWGRITFEISGRSGNSERDGEFEDFTWRNENGGCVLRAYLLGSRKETQIIDHKASQWGILRALKDARSEGQVDNAHSWSLTAFDQVGPGAKKEPPMLQILVDRANNPFDLSLYAAARLE